MKLRFYCNRGSKGLMTLVKGLRSAGLDAQRIKRRNSRYTYPSSDLLINWGATSLPAIRHTNVLNKPEAVANASDKRKTLALIASPVPWTEDREVAEQWLAEDSPVYCRKLTRASEGRGIVVTHVGEELEDAPLYTKGIPISRELRVHVFNGSVIHYAQKKRMGSERLETEGLTLDEEIRNTKGGWIFAVEGISIPDEAKEAAIEAVSSLGLDFGAVDLIITEGSGQSYVLEVNSAPGITEDSSTLRAYVNALDNTDQG